MRCAVVGAGAWGTALAERLAQSAHEVRIWAYEEDVANAINHTHSNPRFLPHVPLSASITASTAIRDVVYGADSVVMVAPSHVTRAVTATVQPHLSRHSVIIVASKGIEQHTLSLMTTVVEDVLDVHGVVALSGPSFALEVARGQPTALVAASRDKHCAELVQQVFRSSTLRVYTQDDVVGVELGGALKNVIAVATGIAEGLELGFNARAALITRGLAEMTRLGALLGAHPATFAGLAGMGDLVLTCTGQLSRNRSLGLDIGRGLTLDEALAGRDTVAEGVITTRAAKALAARYNVAMPIVDAVHAVLFEGQSPQTAITELMNRDLRPERDS